MQFRLQQNQCVFILNAQPHADDITSTLVPGNEYSDHYSMTR